MTEFLVVGVYAHTHQRFTETFEARTSEDAEKACIERLLDDREITGPDDFIVAAVLSVRTGSDANLDAIEVVA